MDLGFIVVQSNFGHVASCFRKGPNAGRIQSETVPEAAAAASGGTFSRGGGWEIQWGQNFGPPRHKTGYTYPLETTGLQHSASPFSSTKRSSTRTKAVVEVDDPKDFWQKTHLHAEEPEDEDLQLGARLVSVLGHQ